MTSEPENKKKRPVSMLGVGLALGAGIGVALGNIAVGIAIGLAIGAGLDSYNKGKRENEDQD